jgi:cytochrome c biogenesis protein ResB
MVRNGCQRIARGVRHPSAVWSAEQALLSTDSEQLLAVFSTKTILGGAILEGAGFFNVTAYLIEGQGYALVLGLILMVGILIGIPTRHGLESWLEQQQRRIQEIRDMEGLR